MRVTTFMVPGEIDAAALKGKMAVVIDVLRANTSIIHARRNGAERLIPVATIEAATRLLATLDRETTLLCGEREGKRIDGFQLGNSPLEFTPEAVEGKTLILTTTNGTEAMVRLEGAKGVVCCAFINVAAVAASLREEEEVFIACSGRAGSFSLEDAVCAGLLIERLRDAGVADLELHDAAGACEVLCGRHIDDIPGCLRASTHGRYLIELGFGSDLEVCGEVDSVDTVPVIQEGRIG